MPGRDQSWASYFTRVNQKTVVADRTVMVCHAFTPAPLMHSEKRKKEEKKTTTKKERASFCSQGMFFESQKLFRRESSITDATIRGLYILWTWIHLDMDMDTHRHRSMPPLLHADAVRVVGDGGQASSRAYCATS